MSEYRIAIGDVHGEYDMLHRLIHLCQDHMRAAHPGAAYRFVFLGDLVDRGPKSREVVYRARDMESNGDADVIAGNHEDWMSRVVLGKASRDEKMSWYKYGGIQTRESYGRKPQDGFSKEETLAAKWFQNLPIHIDTGHHVFVHAGLNPDAPLGNQTKAFRQWARPTDFASTPFPGRHILFGHSVSQNKSVYNLPGYTGIDTGACFNGGRLTAAVVDITKPGPPIHFIQVHRPSLVERAGE